MRISMMEKFKSFWLTPLIFSLACLVSVFIYFFDFPAIGDSGCFGALGVAMNQGAALYDDVWDNKAPGIFFIHAFFQKITQYWIHYPWLIQTFFLALFLWIFSRLLVTHYSYPVLYFLLLLVIPWVNRLWHFETQFTGGFTEELGIYLMLTSLILYFGELSKRQWTTCLAGLLFGFAIWIKEPFIFFGLPWFVSIFFQNQYKKILLFAMFASIPWLFFGSYLFYYQAWNDYFGYLEFAFLYASGNTSYLDNFITGLQKLMAYLGHTAFIELTFVFLSMIMAFLFKRRNAMLTFIRYGLWMLVSSIPFFILGNQHYGHYFIPTLFIIQFLFVISFLQILHMLALERQLRLNAALTWLVIIPIVVCNIFSFIKCQAWHKRRKIFGSADKEYAALMQILPKKYQHIYVDDPHLGRVYVYTQKKSFIKHVVPYAAYYVPKNMPIYDDVLSDNRTLINREFKNSPPEILVTWDNFSFGIAYSDLSLFVKNHYEEIGTIPLQERTFKVMRLKLDH